MFSWVTNNLRVPTYDDLPSNTYMTCNWGDGSIVTQEAFEMGAHNNMAADTTTHRVYNVKHKYSKQGEYSINCTMNNQVSKQTLTHKVGKPY